MKHLRITVEPSLQSVEEEFDKFLLFAFEKIQKLEEINGFISKKTIENSNNIHEEKEIFQKEYE